MKKVAISLLSSKILFFLSITVLILGLNLTPMILQTLHSPPGRTFVLIHNNAQDFFFYQGLMNEGANGQWLTTDPYSGEPHKPSIIFSYFLWFGKIAKLLSLPYAVAYHFLRIILSILFLLSTFYFLFSTRIPYFRLTYFFFLFASPLMHWVNDSGKMINVPYMYWWTGIDAIRRAAYLPHHMFGSLGLILSLLLIIKYHQNHKIKYIIWLIFFSLLLAFIHTPSLLIILIILPPTILIYILQNIKIKNLEFIKNLKLEIKNYFGFFIYWLIGLLVLFLMVSQTNKGFPWSQYIDWEKRFQFPIYREILGTLGILLPLSLIGIYKAITSRKFHYILITSWIIIPLLLIPLAPILGISNIRLIQGVPFLPLAILASLGTKTLLDFTSSIYKREKYVHNIGITSIIIIFLVFSYPTLSWSLKDQIREFWPIFGNIYLDNRLNRAFSYINQNIPPKSITLATFYTSNYLPSYTHTISFIGHSGYTYNIDEKQKLVAKFFESNMSEKEVKDFLSTYKVDLIFQGPEEKPIYKDHLYPDLLKVVYDEEEATLYKPNF